MSNLNGGPESQKQKANNNPTQWQLKKLEVLENTTTFYIIEKVPITLLACDWTEPKSLETVIHSFLFLWCTTQS